MPISPLPPTPGGESEPGWSRQLLDVDVDLADDDPTPTGPSAPLLRVTSGELPLQPADVEIDIDCEIDTDGCVYLWGAAVDDCGTQTYHHFGVATSDVDEHEISKAFAGWLLEVVARAQSAGRTVKVYFYSATEATQLGRLVPAIADQILSHSVDLLSVIRSHFYAPYGYGLKTLATAVAGHQWRSDCQPKWCPL